MSHESPQNPPQTNESSDLESLEVMLNEAEILRDTLAKAMEDRDKKRQEEITEKLREILSKCQDLKNKIEPSNSTESPETSPSDLNKFLLDTYKGWGVDQTKLDTIKWSQNTISPKNENYQTKKDDIDPSKYGEYTLNPETKDIDWDKIPPNKIKTVELPASMNGLKLSEIGEYLKTTYPNAKLPGLEYYKYIVENPAKAPQSLKDGNYYFFYGSLFRRSDGRWDVPSLDGGSSGFSRRGFWLDRSWNGNYRVVLLEL